MGSLVEAWLWLLLRLRGEDLDTASCWKPRPRRADYACVCLRAPPSEPRAPFLPAGASPSQSDGLEGSSAHRAQDRGLRKPSTMYSKFIIHKRTKNFGLTPLLPSIESEASTLRKTSADGPAVCAPPASEPRRRCACGRLAVLQRRAASDEQRRPGQVGRLAWWAAGRPISGTRSALSCRARSHNRPVLGGKRRALQSVCPLRIGAGALSTTPRRRFPPDSGATSKLCASERWRKIRSSSLPAEAFCAVSSYKCM